MSSAQQFYIDPSALLKLYLHEPESRAMAMWRAKITGPLAVTHHGRVELINGIALAAHHGFLPAAAFQAALAALEDDFEQGRYAPADLLWRAVLKRAADLSRAHTPALGTRSLDVLHVASALELGLKRFVTFDTRQSQLALAAGLKVVTPSG
ncbi:MAG: type II toxin-antitoxin system VapC family toxin [Verrucomicrobia bacterium]|nr:type II toxin-antitoxin system VapC family toxin [Verrucomicrobiota bacterium]